MLDKQPWPRTPLSLLQVAIAVVGCGLAPNLALAQRGHMFVEQTDAPARTQRGMPSVFNTAVAPNGGIVVDFPTFSFQYGVTENLTIGTSALALLPITQGEYSGIITARYRMFSNDRVTSVLDLAVGRASLPEDMDTASAKVFLGVIGSATSVRVGRWHELTAHVLAGQLAFSITEKSEDAPLRRYSFDGVALAAGATYTFVPLQWFSVSASVFSVPNVVGEIDGPEERQTFETFSTRGALKRSFYRLAANFRVRSWLFQPSAFGVPGDTPVPWLSITKVF